MDIKNAPVNSMDNGYDNIIDSMIQLINRPTPIDDDMSIIPVLIWATDHICHAFSVLRRAIE